MKKNLPILIIEINNENYLFATAKLDQNLKFYISEKIIYPNNEIKNGKITKFEEASQIIKTQISKIENKVDYVFKEAILISDVLNYSCINVSGFKKLNGSQVLKENISYILNSLKFAVTQNEKKKTILHIFNSKSQLDGVISDNLPIGLYGNFYSHELTFFLAENNDLKNLRNLFSTINLRIDKILLKSFSEGTRIINTNKSCETFFKISFNKDFSELIFFENSSFKYSEKFNFGTEIIYRDIAKVCSLKIEKIEDFFKNNLEKNFDKEEILEQKYFDGDNFRKIRKKIILDIAIARVEEIIDKIFYKNINLKNYKHCNKVILKFFDDIFSKEFINYFLQNNIDVEKIDNTYEETSLLNAANLNFYGWKKEAIPIVQPKNSVITRIFNYLFE